MTSALQQQIAAQQPLLWRNDRWRPDAQMREAALGLPDMLDAEARLQRFAPPLAHLFPELAASGGIIESELLPVGALKQVLLPGGPADARWFIKADHALPVAGSIKARGGIYEVLVHAERLALAEGLLDPAQNPAQSYLALAEPAARALFERNRIVVGSTGNLGLGIGLMASALGFAATVHMSSDAKAWKKAKLREHGVEVFEHDGDFTAAVAEGRRQAEADARAYFVDDENSPHLFLGYSVAALRLQRQLEAAGVVVDARRPLIVYLPCGVGGAPGGITFGLRALYGDHAHCFFAEPTAAPAMLVRLALGGDAPMSIDALGLDGKTEADGLAVGTASEFVAPLMAERVSGIYTLRDDEMFDLLAVAHAYEGLKLEPSAAAGFEGPGRLAASGHPLADPSLEPTHVIWTTGGQSVPDEIFRAMLAR